MPDTQKKHKSPSCNETSRVSWMSARAATRRSEQPVGGALIPTLAEAVEEAVRRTVLLRLRRRALHVAQALATALRKA